MFCRSGWMLAALLLANSISADVTNRHIALDGQPNFRDLGGYVTSDFRTVKRGQIFRSGELPRLTDADVARLDALGLKTVISFLTPEEIAAKGRDRLPAGVNEIELPLTGGVNGDLAAKVLEARQTGDFSEVPVEINPELHRLLIREARDEYAALLRSAADPANRPLVFHCSHGVHRTGTATALLLSALGVPWETVREDYLLSNTYRGAEIEKRLKELRVRAAETFGIPPGEVDMTNIEAFYILQGEYIDASLEEAVKLYGSMDTYIREGLGITEQEISALRKQLLE